MHNVDEELTQLDESVRRLKVEYDIYFGGGSPKPPADVEWRVRNLLRKYADGHNMNFGQRFRFNTIQQRYALFSALWQQKLRIKEEGYRRPQDALFGIQGMRVEEQHAAEKALKHHGAFSIYWSDADSEPAKVEALFHAFSEACEKSGDKTPGTLDSFKKFVRQKTAQIRKEYDCGAVEYSVEVKAGHVRLKAKPKT